MTSSQSRGEAAGQGIYVAEHQAATQLLNIASSDPTNDRIDLIVARIYDDEADSSGNSYTDVEVDSGDTGRFASSVPALPNGAIPLAEVLVQASVSAITNSDITDVREEAPVRGTFVETVAFTSSGTFDKADYPWLRRLRVRVQGQAAALVVVAAATSTGSGEALRMRSAAAPEVGTAEKTGSNV